MSANSNLNDKLIKFCSNMKKLDQMSQEFCRYYHDLSEEIENDENIWLKLDANITYAFANTSIYWLHHLLNRSDLKDHPIKNEILRVRKYMHEYMLKKKDAPRLDTKISKRIIRNALWQPEVNRQSTSSNHNTNFSE
ncbi:Nuclear nucleic acid-binding protein C1D [Sarcoptes scabiei]|nr:Nuclear nucleic acid-binding protein C1D [Sarcoptes scabiei]